MLVMLKGGRKIAVEDTTPVSAHWKANNLPKYKKHKCGRKFNTKAVKVCPYCGEK